MYLEKLLLKNYRNIREVFLEFDKNLNIFTGLNGQGKTNLIKSIYLMGTGSSHRTSIDRELIEWQKEKTLIQLLLNRREQNLKLSLKLDESGKSIEINNNPIERVSELIGTLNVVLFSPEDLNLVKGGPSYRRKFLDIEISQVSSYYFYLLNKYKHILKQRNKLLKEIRQTRGDKKLLGIWDEKLAETGSRIINKRREVVEKLKLLARLSHRQITAGNEELNIYYETSLKNNDKIMDTELIFMKNLVNNREEEIIKGYTVTGPHRDDLILKGNNIDLRKYGSQGQQRTAALALKMAELEFMKSETGEYPVLLLDDVFSELDKNRRSTLLGLIAGKIQSFITTTDINDIHDLEEFKSKEYSLFEVNEGKIRER